MTYPAPALLNKLAELLGPRGYTSDPETMAPWLVDWRGRYRGAAAALLSPQDVGEVQAIVRACAEAKVAIVPQGGNTSMVAGATPDPGGDAVIVSLRRMNRIRALDARGMIAVCEAGLILAELHAAAEAEGLRFPLSLGAKGSATIGGLVSTNAGGTQVLRFGTMRDLVVGIEAVLPDGSLIESLMPLRKDSRGLDPARLLIGAEGTLGIVTAASLRLVPAAAARAVAWVGLAGPDQAAALLGALEKGIGPGVESFELVPASALDLVLAHVPGTRAPLAARHEWNVLVEVAAAAGAADPAERLGDALAAALEPQAGADAVVAANEAQAEALWRLRESIAEAERKDGPAAKHDVSVPVPDMPDFLVRASAAVEASFPGCRVNGFGHLGDGNIHFNVRAPLGAGASWLQEEAPGVSAFVHDLVTAAGGSISAEHGIGQAKLAEFARTAPPARLAALQAVKRALDPAGIMNPGKLVPLAKSPAVS